ncbi:protein spire homolog 1-like isoform X1 [Hemiscyllium ocellatum]|uniref:protein spire homolog 1-like isoform X1 n=1 Tax=Hemiscyllium ocellatum TaxID=170820 RepID=UPI002965F108|nr:protein spire homolog 1-like isoform X1 [Hemiscyllium ocellatum]
MAERCSGSPAPECGAQADSHDPESQELSLEHILKLYNQPLNEEQAWAVCYQCCSSLQRQRRPGDPQPFPGRLSGTRAVILQRDGNISIRSEAGKDKVIRCTEPEVIESVGILVYKALDWGLKDNEERELSPPLEQLIGQMTNILDEALKTEGNLDEGYDAQDEEEEQKEITVIRNFKHVMMLCAAHLTTPSEAPNHYQAVCRALFAESMELRTFLAKIKSAKENLKKLLDEKGESSHPNMELNELNNFDWACFWVQVMRDLRNGVKLKKVQERQYNPLPIEYQLTPYEMLMDDIRSRRYTLRKVMVNGNLPPKLKKSAHEMILDFIRSRPPLNPASARKLKPHPPRPRSLHERILEEIKSERKLRPVSPDMIRRSKHVMRPLSMSCSFDLSDVTTPERSRKTSPPPMANGAVMSQITETDAHTSQVQRRRLLKAPTLAEIDSSDSEEERIKMLRSSSSGSTFKVEDSSPDTPNGKKTPPMFLPISSTPQPERRKQPQRRHSIEKETPTNVRQFLPPSRQSSKSLVSRLSSLLPRMSHRLFIPSMQTVSMLNSCPLEAAMFGLVGAVYFLCEGVFTSRWKTPKEEFCYPVECLALTVEEVMHIRQVLVKAELEKYQQYKDVYTALKKGKLCFCCRTKRFSIFTWSYTCQFCKRPVCSQCCKKMRLPSKPYSNLPIFSLGPSALPKEGKLSKSERPSGSRRRHDGQHKSLVRFPSVSKPSEKSTDSLEFPKELMEDWSTMEVCVDCKKFISEIISSSRRSLVLANKRARLKRKTQSFYMSSESASEFRLAAPKERTIKEV